MVDSTISISGDNQESVQSLSVTRAPEKVCVLISSRINRDIPSVQKNVLVYTYPTDYNPGRMVT